MSNFTVDCQLGSIGYQYVPSPLRLYKRIYSSEYSIQSFPARRPKETVVYITTQSPAIVTYVLGSGWQQQLHGSRFILYNPSASDWTDTEEEELSMRILRAGGAVLDTTYPPQSYTYEMDEPQIQYEKQFGAFSRTKDFIFGWPHDGGLWILYLDGLVPLEYWKAPYVDCSIDCDGKFGAVCQELMEREEEEWAEYHFSGLPKPLPDGAFNTTNLNQATTMTEFCAELKNHGATFYEDPATAREAVKLAFFNKDALMKTWNGFTQWREADIQYRNDPDCTIPTASRSTARSLKRWWFM